MVSKFAILTNLLLASAVLAVPSLRLPARLARRDTNHQSQLVSLVDSPPDDTTSVQYTDNWAGAVWNETEGTFTSVTATFTVPTPSGPDGAASAWVGIDGYSCKSAILQTGIDITLSNGVVSYDAWYEWYPNIASDFTNITINAGDKITATVTAFTKTSGQAVIHNWSTGEIVQQELLSVFALCEQDAEWIVEDFTEAGILVPFVDFGTVLFVDAVASTGNNTNYYPDGATLLDIRQDNQVLTTVSAFADTLNVTYIGQ